MFGLVKGTIKRTSGANGTVDTTTIPAGSRILKVLIHSTSAGTVKFSQDAANIPIPASASWFELNELHVELKMPASGTIVFTGTDSYVIEWVGPAGVS